MKKLILFLLFLCPIAFYGEENTGSTIVGSIGGNINVSVIGGAVYTIPLEIPQGVNGMQPEIGIIYNSQSGNGLLGYGWNINGVSTITRTGSTLYHDGKMTSADFSADDRFLLDGQRLIMVGNSGNNYEYKTENDEFAKIVLIKENGYFSKCEVRLENGNIIKYGYTSNSKLMAADGNNVIKWMVSSIEDRNGNTVSYDYTTFGTNSDLYISTISYTSNSQAGLSAQFTVSFSYSTTNRFDNYHYYIAGNKVLCNRILTGISVIKDNEIIESYSFTYYTNTNRMYNLLKEISFSKGSASLNPTVIRWNTDETDIQNNSLYSQQINTDLLNEFSFIGDFNGDGYSDLLTVPYEPETGYSGNITAKVFFNDMDGGFGLTPDHTLSVPDSLDWIHVLDINGDGYDDLVVQTLVTTYDIHNYPSYNTGLILYENQQGSDFDSITSYDIASRLLVRSGDFWGEGQTGMLLCPIDAGDSDNNYYSIQGNPFFLHFDNNYSLDTIPDYLLELGVAVTGDFTGNGKTEVFMLSAISRAFSFYKQNGQYRIAPYSIGFYGDEDYPYFTGDFNDDGKTDLFFSDHHNDKYVVLSTGTGFTDWISVTSTLNSIWNNMVLPQMQTYHYSLSNVDQDPSYGVNFSDIDGDRKTDIIYFNGDNRPVFFRDFNLTANGGRFRVEYQASNSDINFMNQFFTMGNFLGQDHVSFVAVDPYNPSITTDDIVKIFSFPSTSERFSVNSITDGMGKSLDIEYEYLMPGQTDFYSFANRAYVNEIKPYPVPMLAMKSYTEHVGSNYYKTQFKYGNVLVHRTGRGFINFEIVEKKTLINNAPVKLEKSKFEVTTTGANALALPQCDSTFLYNAGILVLSETNSYNFNNIRCSRQQTSNGFRHITRPAMTLKKTKRFNPDNYGELMSVEIDEYTYTTGNNSSYSDSYHCANIMTGYNRNDCNSFYNCEYKTGTSIQYMTNDYTNWIIGRKSQESTITVFASQPSITTKKSYTYSTTSPYLVTSLIDAPKASGNNRQTVRHDYLYDACGNMVSETISAPYGTHNEPQIVTSYTYSNYRLMATKTTDPNGLVYQDQYTYDKYDRVTSHIGSNGLTTTYTYNNPFGSQTTTIAPGNVVTTEQISWSAGDNLAPTNASYCKYNQTSSGSTTGTFYDANGNAIRTIEYNYEYEPVIVDVEYNDRQLPKRQSNPYLEGDTPRWTKFQYDGLGRLTSTILPDDSETSTVYNGYTITTAISSGNSTHTATQTTNYLGWVTCNTDASNASVSYTYYSDGQVATMTTSGGNVTVSMNYDDARNRTSLNDMDYGQTTSVYDAYGRLMQQTTPKSDQFNYTYDVLGRITRKDVQGDATTTLYQYNENTHKGTLASITYSGQSLQYTYDSYDRLLSVTETRNDSVYTTSYTYNSNSQINSKTYPSGYAVYYGYFPNGTKRNVKDASGNTLWQANEINACGQLVRAATGNGAVTTNKYDDATNRLAGSATSNGIQNFAYTFDGFGNLTSRTDSIGTIKTETFTYDNLDRLTGITLNNVGSDIVYDNYGRMTSKQKDGLLVFSSAQFSQTKPHATTNVRTASSEFPIGQTAEYNSLDKIKLLTQGSKIATFTYGYDAQRMKMTVVDTLTGRTKIKEYVDNCEFVDDNGTKKAYTYLMGPYGVFAMVERSGGTDKVHYIYKDHLGSWTTITDENGTVEERRSFDAWGNFRDASTWSGNMGRTPKFDRGFTGHEHLLDFGLINMNGRMYDPLLSSFLSPDNYMQDPTTQQGFNRYAYCMYNPLKYIDPTGERQMGWSPSTYYYEQMARLVVLKEQYRVYEVAMASHWLLMDYISNCVFSQGPNAMGSSGSGNHGSGGDGVKIGSEAFKKLCEKHGIEPGKPIPKDKQTDAFLKEFQQTFFPDAPMDHVKKIVVENLDKEYYFHNDDNLGGKTIPLTTKSNGTLTGNSNVYFNEDYVFVSPENLFYAMGHEFVHVSQFAGLKGVERDILSDPDFIMTIEYHANAWGLSVGRGINRSYDRFENEMITCYSGRYHLDYTYYYWTYNLIHP